MTGQVVGYFDETSGVNCLRLPVDPTDKQYCG
jgi:hypothetical protein